MSSGSRSSPSYQRDRLVEMVVAPGQSIVWYLRGYCGYLGPERDRRILRIGIRTLQPVGVACESGMKLTCSRTCGEPFSPSWTITASWIGMRCSWMQASFRQKKGRGGRENQAGKGIEVPSIGRWQGCSSRKPYRQCLAG